MQTQIYGGDIIIKAIFYEVEKESVEDRHVLIPKWKYKVEAESLREKETKTKAEKHQIHRREEGNWLAIDVVAYSRKTLRQSGELIVDGMVCKLHERGELVRQMKQDGEVCLVLDPDTAENSIFRIFDRDMDMKFRSELKYHPVRRGTGVFGDELSEGNFCTLWDTWEAKNWRRRGICSAMVELCGATSMRMGSDIRWAFCQPGYWNAEGRRQEQTSLESECPVAIARAGMEQKSINDAGTTSFWHAMGARRIGLKNWFCIALDKSHPSYLMPPRDDAIWPPADQVLDHASMKIAQSWTRRETTKTSRVNSRALVGCIERTCVGWTIRILEDLYRFPLHTILAKATSDEHCVEVSSRCVSNYPKNTEEWTSSSWISWHPREGSGTLLHHAVILKEYPKAVQWLLGQESEDPVITITESSILEFLATNFP